MRSPSSSSAAGLVALLTLLQQPAALSCPGSPASMMHASAHLTVDVAQSCDLVKAEVSARIGGDNGWTDPHNHGTDSCVRLSVNLLTNSPLLE